MAEAAPVKTRIGTVQTKVEKRGQMELETPGPGHTMPCRKRKHRNVLFRTVM